MPGENETASAPLGRIQTFQYHKPPGQAAPRAEVTLCGNENFRSTAHVILAGAVDGLHYESGVDELWMVLAGRARFCGPRRTLIGEFAIGEGLLIPRNTQYLVESIGEVDLELLQVAVHHRGEPDRRVELEEPESAVERHSGRAL